MVSEGVPTALGTLSASTGKESLMLPIFQKLTLLQLYVLVRTGQYGTWEGRLK